MAKQGKSTAKRKRPEGFPQERLTDEAREFVVAQLAMFDPPSVVARAVKEEFGFEIAPQSIEAYDPTKRAGKGLGKRWAELFRAMRRDFVDGKVEIGIANKMTRLRTLERLARKTESSGNVGMTAQLLEQAAKESGDHYSNRRLFEHTGKNGGPIVSVNRPDLSKLTREQRAALKPLLEDVAGAAGDA